MAAIPEKTLPAPDAGCAREQYWDEMDDARRVQVLGRLVEDLAYTVREQRQEMDLLRMHTHGEKGELLAPLDATNPRHPRYDGFPNNYRPNPLNRERR
jgi:hypothetical protein